MVPLKKEKTHFTVRLTEMKATDKVKLIKEVKNFVPGVNLVQVRRCCPKLCCVAPRSSSLGSLFKGSLGLCIQKHSLCASQRRDVGNRIWLHLCLAFFFVRSTGTKEEAQSKGLRDVLASLSFCKPKSCCELSCRAQE